MLYLRIEDHTPWHTVFVENPNTDIIEDSKLVKLFKFYSVRNILTRIQIVLAYYDWLRGLYLPIV